MKTLGCNMRNQEMKWNECGGVDQEENRGDNLKTKEIRNKYKTKNENGSIQVRQALDD